MPKAMYDWDSIDKSLWGTKPDSEIAKEYGVDPATIRYWRLKNGIASYEENIREERSKKHAEGLAWCSGCERYLPFDSFGKYERGPYGLRHRCKACRKAYYQKRAKKARKRARQYYQENKKKVKKQNARWRKKNRGKIRKYMAERNAELRTKYIELMGGKCQRCGYSEFIAAMAFHHVNPEAKQESAQSAVVSGDHERAVEELDKCVLLCFNCHQGMHSSEWGAEFVKRKGLGWTLKA